MLQAVIFDIGNVLVEWSPYAFFVEHGYSQEAAERLLDGPVSLSWHSRADAGMPIQENVRQRILEYPDATDALTLYLDRWQETIRGEIAGSVDCLKALSAGGMPLYALTNFPADTFPAFASRFAFMQLFKDVLVSGEVGLKKPDPRIFALAADRFGIEPQKTLFIDDRMENCQAAADLGFQAYQFTEGDRLMAHLVGLGGLR